MASPRPASVRATSPGVGSQPNRSGASGRLRAWRALAPTLIQHSQEPMQLTAGRGMGRVDVDCGAELADGRRDVVPDDVDVTEVDVRIVARLVADGPLGPLEPRDRLIEATELDEVRADVVVGIAELGIDRDRAMALGDRILP